MGLFCLNGGACGYACVFASRWFIWARFRWIAGMHDLVLPSQRQNLMVFNNRRTKLYSEVNETRGLLTQRSWTGRAEEIASRLAFPISNIIANGD
jgi:hypothetical protein